MILMLHQPHVSNKIVPKLNLPQNIVKCKRHRDDDSAKIGHGAIRTREYWQKARNYYRRNQITTRDTHTEIVIRWFPRSHHARAWHLALEAWNGQNDRSPITRPRRRRVGTISYANSFFFWDRAESFLPFPIFIKIFSFPPSSRTTKDNKTACEVYGEHFFRKYIEKSGPQAVLVLRNDFSKISQKSPMASKIWPLWSAESAELQLFSEPR
jgi:hypothetical protein